MAQLSPAQAKALQILVLATIDAIKDCGPQGAPGGVLYAAMMHHGASLSQFESLMGALVRTGRISKRGDCYFA